MIIKLQITQCQIFKYMLVSNFEFKVRRPAGLPVQVRYMTILFQQNAFVWICQFVWLKLCMWMWLKLGMFSNRFTCMLVQTEKSIPWRSDPKFACILRNSVLDRPSLAGIPKVLNRSRTFTVLTSEHLRKKTSCGKFGPQQPWNCEPILYTFTIKKWTDALWRLTKNVSCGTWPCRNKTHANNCNHEHLTFVPAPADRIAFAGATALVNQHRTDVAALRAKFTLLVWTARFFFLN